MQDQHPGVEADDHSSLVQDRFNRLDRFKPGVLRFYGQQPIVPFLSSEEKNDFLNAMCLTIAAESSCVTFRIFPGENLEP